MKRDMDLIRRLLLAIEDGARVFPNDAPEGIDQNVLEYHLRLMEEAELIDVQTKSMSGKCLLRGLTWSGHDFLDAVRQPEMWERTKQASRAVGSTSFEFLWDVAKSLARHQLEEFLKAQL